MRVSRNGADFIVGVWGLGHRRGGPDVFAVVGLGRLAPADRSHRTDGSVGFENGPLGRLDFEKKIECRLPCDGVILPCRGN